MHKLLHILGFVVNKFFILMLVVFMLIFVPLVSFIGVATDSSEVKKILADADVYNTVPDNFLHIVELDQEIDAETLAPGVARMTVYDKLDASALFDPDDLVEAIKTVFDDEFLKAQTENVIESFYSYAEGETEELEFSIDLSDRKDAIVAAMSDFVEESIASAPVCNQDQLLQQSRNLDGSEDIDVFEAACVPSDIVPSEQANEFVSTVLGENDIFEKGITQDDIDLSGVDLSILRYGFKLADSVVLFAWLSIVGLGLVVALTSKNLHRGLLYSGAAYVVIGVVLSVAFTAAPSMIAEDKSTLFSNDGISASRVEAMTEIAGPIIDSSLSALTSSGVSSSIPIGVLGIVFVAFGILAKKHGIDHLHLHRSHRPDGAKSESQSGSSVTAPDNDSKS